jgi:hypothetical protein
VKALKGTYSEAVTINKPLNVIGDSADTTIINGSGVALSAAGLVKITANSGDVKFSGFTVCDAAPVGGVIIAVNVGSNLAGPIYEISGNKIYGSFNPDEAEDYGFYSGGGKESLKFQNNVVSGTGANNIVIECHTGPTEISSNTLDAGVWGTDSIFYMTYGGVDITTLQNVSYNYFDMGTGGPDFDYWHRATGISFTSPGPYWGLTEGKFTNMVASGNVFVNLRDYRRAIGTWNAGTGDNLQGLIITNNMITGVPGSVGSFGIDFINLTTGTIISGNTIRGTERGIVLRSGSAPGTMIFHNNIFNNTIGLDWSPDPAGINASLNWWGDPTGPYDPELNPSGKGDEVSNYVEFEPWLIAPYPPASQVEAILYVDPPSIEHWTVSYGKIFEVDINIAAVTLLYGYEFKLYWNTTLLDLLTVQICAPWGSFTIGKNETREDLGRYWLSVACVSPAPPFNGSTTLAKLTFKITHDPVYPENDTCKLDLEDTKLAAPPGVPIYHMTRDGAYTIYSTKPCMRIEPSLCASHVFGETFKINVTISDVVDLYNFSFKLSYNTTLLDATAVQVGPFLNTPTYLNKFIIDDASGLIWLWVWSTDGALPVSGNGVLATITFKVTCATLWRVNNTNILSCVLDLHDTLLATNSGIEVPHEALDGIYRYEPKPGDLDMDGKVGLSDLRIVAYYYDPAYNQIADLNEDNIVDLYDLTIVSYYYGGDC